MMIVIIQEMFLELFLFNFFSREFDLQLFNTAKEKSDDGKKKDPNLFLCFVF